MADVQALCRHSVSVGNLTTSFFCSLFGEVKESRYDEPLASGLRQAAFLVLVRELLSIQARVRQLPLTRRGVSRDAAITSARRSPGVANARNKEIVRQLPGSAERSREMEAVTDRWRARRSP